MKYVLLLTRGEWQETGTDEVKADVFAGIEGWFGPASPPTKTRRPWPAAASASHEPKALS